MNHKQARQRLIDYMNEVFRLNANPTQRIDISLEEIAEFCDLLRKGCQQDCVRLFLKLAREADGDGFSPQALEVRRETLLDVAGMIQNGGDIKVWGLNDCSCDKVDCVYCGPRIAKRALATSK